MSRIAFVGYSYGVDPRLIGGHQSILRRLTGFLAGRGHSVDYVVFGEKSSQTIDLGSTSRLFTFTEFAAAARHLKAEQYDYVQLSYLPTRSYPAAVRFLAWQHRQPGHPKLGYLYVVWPPRAVMRLARVALFKAFCDRVVAVSPRLHRELLRHHVPATLMLPPVPDSFFEPALRPSSPPRVGYIGRVDADKGVQQVVSILHDLKERHPEVQTEIAGYVYPHSAASSELHKRLLAQDVIHYEGGSYHGFEPAMEDRVLARLRRTDLLLLPYQHLSGITVDVPLLLLEAMAAGCTVVTSTVADLPEIVARPELLADGLPAMRAIVSTLIEQGQLASIGASLRRRAEELGVRVSVAGARYEQEVGLA